jgi:type III pantothenate kinase
MALCKPVLGTAVGGILEQVEQGTSGLLVPPDDDLAMAEASGELLASNPLREEMGAWVREDSSTDLNLKGFIPV